MDGGALQQEQAAKIRLIVKRSGRGKKRTSTVYPDTGSRESGISRELSLSATSVTLSENCTSETSVFSEFPTSADEVMWADLFGNDSLASQALLSPCGSNDMSSTTVNMDWEFPWVSAGSTGFVVDSSPELGHMAQGQEMEENSETSVNIAFPSRQSASLEYLMRSTFCNQARQEAQCQDDTLMLESLGIEDPASSGVHSLASRCGGDDMLFMHYLDTVFYIQYPFFDAHKKQKRGWLLSILNGAKAVYHASLALSEYHFLSTQLQDFETTTSLMKVQSKDGYCHLAGEELNSIRSGFGWWDESTRRVRSIECLACILQLLFLEVNKTILCFAVHADM